MKKVKGSGIGVAIFLAMLLYYLVKFLFYFLIFFFGSYVLYFIIAKLILKKKEIIPLKRWLILGLFKRSNKKKEKKELEEEISKEVPFFKPEEMEELIESGYGIADIIKIYLFKKKVFEVFGKEFEDKRELDFFLSLFIKNMSLARLKFDEWFSKDFARVRLQWAMIQVKSLYPYFKDYFEGKKKGVLGRKGMNFYLLLSIYDIDENTFAEITTSYMNRELEKLQDNSLKEAWLSGIIRKISEKFFISSDGVLSESRPDLLDAFLFLNRILEIKKFSFSSVFKKYKNFLKKDSLKNTEIKKE